MKNYDIVLSHVKYMGWLILYPTDIWNQISPNNTDTHILKFWASYQLWSLFGLEWANIRIDIALYRTIWSPFEAKNLNYIQPSLMSISQI